MKPLKEVQEELDKAILKIVKEHGSISKPVKDAITALYRLEDHEKEQIFGKIYKDCHPDE